MAQSSLGGFLKGLFGRQAPPPSQPTEALPKPTPEAPSLNRGTPKAARSVPLPASDAYLNRRRGRKPRSEGWPILEALLDAIQSRGEAIPGDLAKALGMSRSTLAYNLKLLVSKGCIERLGGGRSIRYRATGKELR